MNVERTSNQTITNGQYVLYGSLLLLALITVVIVRNLPKTKSSEVSPSAFRVPPLRPSYHWSNRSATAVIAIRDGCHFCEDSSAFYQRLVSLERQGKISARIIFVMPDAEKVGKFDVPSNTIENQAFYNIPLASFGVRGTPTILVISNSEQVVRAWQGELTSNDQDRVISYLK
jgi:hypothetical protein